MAASERTKKKKPIDPALDANNYYYGAGYPSEELKELFKPEANKERIGDIQLGILKFLIRELVRHEFRWGDLYVLNNKRKQLLIHTILVLFALGVLSGGFYLWVREPTSSFQASVSGEKIKVTRTYNDFSKTRLDLVMRIYDDKWHICPSSEGFAGCEQVFTPFEIPFDNRSKFIFVGNGKVYWVDNDRIGVKALKFQDGEWWYEDENNHDEWTSFGTYNQLLYEAEEYRREQMR